MNQNVDRQNCPAIFSKDNFDDVRKYHQSLPGYQETPLINLRGLAKKLGIKAVLLKDESKRFGLNAFKGLGASYAMHKIIQNDRDKKRVFVTATDGNHGKAVAWAAQNHNSQAVIFMPKGSDTCRVEAIEAFENAKVVVTDLNYDDTVRMAAAYAKEHNACLIQDTAFEGYEEIPGNIMLGYTTMAAEAVSQLAEAGYRHPTHIFLQAGVGSMAGGVLGYFIQHYGADLPKVYLLEAEEVACFYESFKNHQRICIGGNPKTIMAGLNCGEPNTATLPMFQSYVTGVIKCRDDFARQGMITLARPNGTDQQVVSGECGAVGIGLLLYLQENQLHKEMLGLNADSVVLLFSTEGDTNLESYRQIVRGREEAGSDEKNV